MAQLLLCDLCKEIIKTNDKKYIFAYYKVNQEEDEETRKMQFEELIKNIYAGKCDDRNIKVVEICDKCIGVFGHFMSLRQKELKKSRKEVKRILARKVRTEKIKRIKEEKKKHG